MIRVKTTAIALRLLAIAGLHLPMVRRTNKEMLRFLQTERRVLASKLTEFSGDRRGSLRWLGWATRAGLIQSESALSSELRYLPRRGDSKGWYTDPDEKVYELTKKGENEAWEACEALHPRSLSDRYHLVVWRLGHLEQRRRRRRSGRFAVASAIGLAGYVVCLLVIFHSALKVTGLETELGEAVCLVLPILSMAVAVGLARAQRFRNEAKNKQYEKEAAEEAAIPIDPIQEAEERYREDCFTMGSEWADLDRERFEARQRSGSRQ
jgi:hypothetical protein